MNTTATPVSAKLVQAIENAWAAIQTVNPAVPDVVVTIGSGAVARGLKFGHFAANVWTKGDTDVHELFVGGEGLQRGAQALMGTLLHEASHAAAEAKGIQDTSRQGRYHNKNFKAIAEEMGIEVTHSESLGWSSTTMPDATAAVYADAILDLDACLTAYRAGYEFLFTQPIGTSTTGGTIPVAKTTGRRTNNNNGVAAKCDCGRRIRVSRSVFEIGGIACNVCGSDFKEA